MACSDKSWRQAVRNRDFPEIGFLEGTKQEQYPQTRPLRRGRVEIVVKEKEKKEFKQRSRKGKKVRGVGRGDDLFLLGKFQKSDSAWPAVLRSIPLEVLNHVFGRRTLWRIFGGPWEGPWAPWGGSAQVSDSENLGGRDGGTAFPISDKRQPRGLPSH